MNCMEFISNIDEAEYTKFVSNHEKSHFLQSYEWGRVATYRNSSPYYVGLRENGELKATALLLKKSLPLGYSYFYIPRGFVLDYNDFNLIEVFTKEIKKFAKKHKALYFRIDPDIKLHTINDMAEVIPGENNYQLVEFLEKLGYKRKPLTVYFETSQPRYTFRIDLTRNIDEIISSFSSTARNAIKRADQYHVKVKIGKKEDVKEFIRLMKMTEIRQDFYSHDSAFYDKFYDIFSKDNHLKVLLAELNFKDVLDVISKKIDEESNKKKIDQDHLRKLKEEKKFYEEKEKLKDSEIVSAYFMVYYGNKSWYLYGANDMEYKSAFANYKIFDYQVRKAKEEGIEIFDEFGTIGNPKSTKSIIGIHDFKKKWGGEYTEFIGEFDYILKPISYKVYHFINPIRHRIVNKRLRKENHQNG